MDAWEAPAEVLQLLRSLPTKQDLTVANTVLRQSLAADIQLLRDDIAGLRDRLERVENGHRDQSTLITETSSRVDTHHHLLHTLTRHVEDLENRGRRQNVRIRGLPEGEGSPAELGRILLRLFNTILGRDHTSHIDIERYHRALRPKGPADAPPRDVICFFLRFGVKEEIMRRARERPHIKFEGVTIALFHDVSPITLHTRRALRPLTMALQKENLQYRWLHPFGIQVRTPHGPVTARNEADLGGFLRALHLPPTTLLSWPDPTATYAPETPLPQRHHRPKHPRRESPQSATFTPSSSQEG
uniref:L1 transposable element RRM domain-containing protein n=1 Tax=Leptobrachium leishanense TaxID=445787 RepID=A0A8C5WM23_9ANUR